jgi:hypothetical protein
MRSNMKPWKLKFGMNGLSYFLKVGDKRRPRISSGLSFSLDPVLLHKLWHMQAIVQQQLT